MDCSSITDFQQSTAISIAKKFRNLHIGFAERGMLGGNLVSEAARPKHNDNISYNIVLIFANISNCPRAP